MHKRYSWALLALALALPVQAAVVIADHPAEFVATTPATGWSYLTSGVGDLGDSAAYQSLLWNPGIMGYGYMASGSWGAAWGDRYTYIKQGTFNIGLPGEFTIFAYTVQAGEQGIVTFTGTFAGDDSGGAAGASDGWALALYVNDNQIDSMMQAWTMSPLSLNYDLGYLNPGDTVYFAVGGGVGNWFDRGSFDMKLLSDVPEPGTLVLVGAGAVLLGLLRRRV